MRERERERERERDRQTDRDGCDVIIVSWSWWWVCAFSCPKFAIFICFYGTELVVNSHFPLPKNSHSSFGLSPPKIILWLITETETTDRMYSCSFLLPIDIRNQNNTKNYWKYEKKIVRKGVRGKNIACENLQIAKHKSVRRLFRFYPQQMNSTCASLNLNCLFRGPTPHAIKTDGKVTEEEEKEEGREW